MSAEQPLDTPNTRSAQAGDTSTVIVNDTIVPTTDTSPTPRSILGLAGYEPPSDYALIQFPRSGPTKDLPLDEPIALVEGVNSFFAFRADGTFFFTLNDARFEWKRELTGIELRQIGHVPENEIIRLDSQDHAGREFDDHSRIDLDGHGVEHFRTEPRMWRLDVQGEVIHWPESTITVSQALKKAGFDVTKLWVITLKVKDQPKRPMQLNDVIDLNEPGLERLRVLKGQVNNGDGGIRRQFSLLPRDSAYLDGLGITWQTVSTGGRWLLLDNYPLPKGFSHPSCTIAIGVPEPYPSAQLDMFYCYPALLRTDGIPIPQTQVVQQIDGLAFQRWSRHHAEPWNPDMDCVRTHMALVDESLSREVER